MSADIEHTLSVSGNERPLVIPTWDRDQTRHAKNPSIFVSFVTASLNCPPQGAHPDSRQSRRLIQGDIAMMTLFNLPGPHDVPFAAPLMTGALLAFTMGFIVLKLLDKFVIAKDQNHDQD